MATEAQTAGPSDFIKNLGRMYGMYTGGFLAFIILLAVLEQVGVPNRILGYLFVFFTLAVYAVIGIASRTAQVSEYYVAGRLVPAFYNGMATGADWMSARHCSSPRDKTRKVLSFFASTLSIWAVPIRVSNG